MTSDAGNTATNGRSSEDVEATLLPYLSSGIFREEAVRHRIEVHSREGTVLRILPTWQRWAFATTSLTLVFAVLLACLARIDEYARGPALIRSRTLTEVTAPRPGTLSAIDVRPGDQVVRGQILVRFDASEERREYDSKLRAHETNLLALLQDPTHEPTRQAVAASRRALDEAGTRLTELAVRAPGAGTILDIWARPRRQVLGGDVMLTLLPAGGSFEAIVMIPGEARPRVKAGSRVHLEMDGLPDYHQVLAAEAVAEGVVGPNEVRRFLGVELVETTVLKGPVALVWARLPDLSFTVRGTDFRYHHGMQGQGEVLLRRERIVFLIFPALKALF
jgi:multidrug efflux pump subunit AcrA (membrane-fusion protein)